MVTKTKKAKQTAADAATYTPVPERTGDDNADSEVTIQVKTTKSVTSPSKSKPQSKVEIQEHDQKSVYDSNDMPTGNKLSVMSDSIEQEVLKVQSAEEKDQKWQEIRLILEKLKEDTLREIRKSVKNGTEAVAAIEPGGDIYDQASSERDRELGLLLGDREREKIHSIDEALLRIDDGEYGICEECDEDIPLGRLKAMPFTRHCVKCKSDLEKLQAQTKRVEEERAYREIPLGSEEDES